MKNSQLKLALFSLLLVLCTWGICHYSYSSQSSTGVQIMTASPQSNCKIRAWYVAQVIAMPQLNDYWTKEGLSLEERAKKAYNTRHNARKIARSMMPDAEEVKQLQERDQEKYGNPDGPTFQYLLDKNLAKGISQEEAYESIIESAGRTNAAVNAACQ